MLGIGYWLYFEGVDILANSLLFLQNYGRTFANKLLGLADAYNLGRLLNGEFWTQVFHPLFSFRVGFEIFNGMVDAAPTIVKEANQNTQGIVTATQFQALFGQLIGYANGITCLMQFTMMGAMLYLLQIEGTILLAVAPLFLAFFPLKVTRQKTIEYMWAMLALALKILLMYVFVALANAIGEGLIFPFVENMKIYYAAKENSALITGYGVTCAIITAFTLFIVKFTTALPGDITRFISWSAPGQATAAGAAGLEQGTAGISGATEKGQNAAVQGGTAAWQSTGANYQQLGQMMMDAAGKADDQNDSAAASMLRSTGAALKAGGQYMSNNASAGGINAANGHTGGIAGPAGQIAEAGFNFGKNAVENIASALTPFAKNAPEVAAAFEKYGVGPASSNEKSTNAPTGEKTQSANNGVATKPVGGGNGVTTKSD